MLTAETYRGLALAFPGAAEKPHFDRAAFFVDAPKGRIFTTLAADGRSANLMFDRDTQEFFIEAAGGVFLRLPNKWGDGGATMIDFEIADTEMARSALTHAWRRAAPAKLLADADAPDTRA